MTFWNSSKKKRAAISEKYRFDNLLSVAKEMPVSALPDLIRAIVRPLQSDFLLAVAEEGIDARPHMTPAEFFFKGIGKLQDYEKMKAHELPADDHALSLASDVVLPWPWSRRRYIDNISYIGTLKEMPWKQDKINHHVDLWLPWRIGFVFGGNHSITAGILSGEGTLIPEHVYDMSYLFEQVHTDGFHWFVDGQKAEAVKSGRSAAIFEIGRLLNVC